jgi:hypothetical protein
MYILHLRPKENDITPKYHMYLERNKAVEVIKGGILKP